MNISKKHINLFAVIIILVILLVATQFDVGDREPGALSTDGMESSFMMFDEDVNTTSAKSSRMGIIPHAEPELLTDDTETDKKIIQTGHVNIQVESVSETIVAITSSTEGLGGFIARSDAGEQTDGTRYGSITVRVPSVEFQRAINNIKSTALVVLNESTNANDVTERYVDLNARLKNAEATETAYTQVLQKAVSVTDILSVQQALGNIRGQIESLQGQIQYLDNQADLSTITVNISEETRLINPPKTFRPGASANEAINTLVLIGHWVVTATIWTVIVGLGVGVPAFILFLIGKSFVKRRK